MKVTLDEKNHTCVVEREPGDPGFYGQRNAAGESRLLYHIKNILNKQGYDFIKKRMWRDGHLVDDLQQYLRERKAVCGRRYLAIYNPFWQIEGADARLMREGKVTLWLTDLGVYE